LSKRGNLAIVPAKLPVEEIIANVESGIRSLPIHTAERHVFCSEQSPQKAILLEKEQLLKHSTRTERSSFYLLIKEINSDHINN